jgi:GT2 family glycosyltransferase
MDISFIIVNWNTSALLLDCLHSILNTVSGFTYEIVVVDNGSRDGSVQAVKQQFSAPVTLIENPDNRGFARANNQALGIARGRFIILLNTDTIVQAGAIASLVRLLEDIPAAAVAGPRMIDQDGSLQNSFDNFPSLATELFNKSLLRFLFPGKFAGKNSSASTPFEVESIIGACMAIRRDAIQKVGMLDEDYFFFLEETDWCFRLRAAGWKIYHHPGAAIVHLQGQSKKRRPALARIEYYRSLYLFFWKNRSPLSYAVLRVARFVKVIITCVLNLLGLCLTAGQSRKLREKTAVYGLLLCWHLLLCPDSWSLKKNR